MLEDDDLKKKTIQKVDRIYCNIEEGFGIGHSEVVPLPSYFITTIDRYGNNNTAGLSFIAPINPRGVKNVTFAIGIDRTGHIKDPNEGKTDTIKNIKNTCELVISIAGRKLMKQLWICGQNFPQGISELEITGLTPIESRTVKVPGIKESMVNIEGKLDTFRDFDRFSLIVFKVTAFNYNLDYYKYTRGSNILKPIYEERRMPIEALKMIDPVFEAQWDPEVMSWISLDFNKIMVMRNSESNAPHTDDFIDWMDRAKENKVISNKEYDYIIDLAKKWESDPDPERNGKIKKELTEKFREIVWSTPDTIFQIPIDY